MFQPRCLHEGAVCMCLGHDPLLSLSVLVCNYLRAKVLDDLSGGQCSAKVNVHNVYLYSIVLFIKLSVSFSINVSSYR